MAIWCCNETESPSPAAYIRGVRPASSTTGTPSSLISPDSRVEVLLSSCGSLPSDSGGMPTEMPELLHGDTSTLLGCCGARCSFTCWVNSIRGEDGFIRLLRRDDEG